MRNVVADDCGAHGTGARLVIRDDPGLEILAVDVDCIWQVRVRLRGVEDVGVACGCFSARELDL
jgi:hypothetical protein